MYDILYITYTLLNGQKDYNYLLSTESRHRALPHPELPAVAQPSQADSYLHVKYIFSYCKISPLPPHPSKSCSSLSRLKRG